MTETKTRTARTEHGSVEYEVVECASCNQEVAADDAKDILIADNIKSYSGTHGTHNDFDYGAHGDVIRAKMCQYCIEGDNMTSLSLDTGNPVPPETDRLNSVISHLIILAWWSVLAFGICGFVYTGFTMLGLV